MYEGIHTKEAGIASTAHVKWQLVEMHAWILSIVWLTSPDTDLLIKGNDSHLVWERSLGQIRDKPMF